MASFVCPSIFLVYSFLSFNTEREREIEREEKSTKCLNNWRKMMIIKKIVWEARMCAINDISCIVYRLSWMRNITFIIYIGCSLICEVSDDWINTYDVCNFTFYIHCSFTQSNIVIYLNNDDERVTWSQSNRIYFSSFRFLFLEFPIIPE